MKKSMLILVILAVMAVAATIGLSSGKSNAAPKSRIVTVNEIQANPDAYKGPITVTGVVAKFSKKDPKVFAIIDTAEAKHCKSTGCAEFYLPLTYDKPVPKEWDEINATGQLVERGGLLFEASKIEIVRHLNY